MLLTDTNVDPYFGADILSALEIIYVTLLNNWE